MLESESDFVVAILVSEQCKSIASAVEEQTAATNQ